VLLGTACLQKRFEIVFFCGLTAAVPDGPFLGFSLNEILLNFTNERYEEYLSLDDGLQVTGCTNDAEICEEVMQSRQGDKTTLQKIPLKESLVFHPKIKKCLPRLIQFVSSFSFRRWNFISK